MRRSLKKLAKTAALLILVLIFWRAARVALSADPPPPDQQTLAHAKRVTIYRDAFGVPHIFGETDADAAFGLAYAHAEDDWPTIQAVLAAAQGHLSRAGDLRPDSRQGPKPAGRFGQRLRHAGRGAPRGLRPDCLARPLPRARVFSDDLVFGFMSLARQGTELLLKMLVLCRRQTVELLTSPFDVTDLEQWAVKE